MPKATIETIRKKREQVDRSLRSLQQKGQDIEKLAQASNLNIEDKYGTIIWSLRQSQTRAANTEQEKFDADDRELDHAISALKNIEDSLSAEQKNSYETSSRHSSVSSNISENNISEKSRNSSVSSSSSSSSTSSTSSSNEKKSLFDFMRRKSTDMPKVNEKPNYDGLIATYQLALDNHDKVDTVKEIAKTLKQQPEFKAASKGLSKESLQFAKELKEIEQNAIAVTEKRENANIKFGGPK